MQITTIGLDIAKNVFQVHGIDSSEKVVVRKQLRVGLTPPQPWRPRVATGCSSVQSRVSNQGDAMVLRLLGSC